VDSYKRELVVSNLRRQELRRNGSREASPHAREQHELLEQMESLRPIIKKYTKTIKSNHLIEQIKSFEEKVKTVDAEYS